MKSLRSRLCKDALLQFMGQDTIQCQFWETNDEKDARNAISNALKQRIKRGEEDIENE